MLSNNPFEEAFRNTNSQQPSPAAPAHEAAPFTAAAPPPSVSPVRQQHPQQQHQQLCAMGSSASSLFAQAPAMRPAAAASGEAARDDRRVLVKFRVDPPFKGKEILRPITYFPICTEILVDNDGHFTVPDVPQGPHLGQLDTGVRRDEWTRGSYSMAERRYSEMLDLRELLTYQFPTITIPPLPSKNSVRDVETYFDAGDSIMAQCFNLQFFLKEISAMPEIVFFSEWVPPFFLDPRDSFETGTLVRMRAALRDLRVANKFLDELSQRHRGFTDDAANKIATTSTKLVRSLANFFWGGGSDGSDDSGAHGGDPAVPAPAAETASSGRAVTGGNWSSLPPEANADACAWERTAALLTARRKALKKSAKAFEAYLSAQNARTSEQASVSQAMEGYEGALRQTEAYGKLSEPCHLAALMVEEMTQKEKEFSEGKYLNVCMRLTFESHFVDSVLDATDHVLCLYRAASSNVYDARDPANAAWLQYTAAVSQGLRADYQQRYKRYYTRRMRNMALEQIARPSVDTATAVDTSVRNSAFVGLVKDPVFAAYSASAA